VCVCVDVCVCVCVVCVWDVCVNWILVAQTNGGILRRI